MNEFIKDIKSDQQKLNKAIKIFLIVLLGLGIVYLDSLTYGLINKLLSFLGAIATPFFIALFLNFILFPVVKRLEKLGIKIRWIAIAIVYIILFGLIVLAMILFVPLIVDQLVKLTTVEFPKFFKELNEWAKETGIYENEQVQQILVSIQENFSTNVSAIIIGVLSSISVIFSFILTIVLSPIICFYMLKDHDTISTSIVESAPRKLQVHLSILMGRLNNTIGLYVRGQLIIMVTIGVISSIGYSILGVNYALLFGLLVGLTNIIPYIGALISAIVPIVFSFFQNGVEWYEILSLNIVFQFVEGNLLQPLIMSKQLDVHPLIILASILGFGAVFGTIGVILAVPLTGTVKVVYQYIMEVRDKGDKLYLDDYSI